MQECKGMKILTRIKLFDIEYTARKILLLIASRPDNKESD